jgi:AcrR family transcriptional regulator
MGLRLEPEERQRLLIQRGLTLFSKKGFANLSATELAKRCGVSKGLLFHYFNDKNGYYIEVLRAASEELLALTSKSVSLSGAKRLFAVINDYLDWVEKHPEVYWMLLKSDLGTNEKVKAIHERKRKHYQQVVLDALFPGQVHSPKRIYDFIGASAYVEALVLQWIKTQDLSREVFQQILLAGISRIVLESKSNQGTDL